MSKAAEDLQERRREHISEEFKRAWWWFEPANQEHIHEFSATWEILRRTRAYKLLNDEMRAAHSAIGGTEEPSLMGATQAKRLSSQLRRMLPQSSSDPIELRRMVERWQNMIFNGWTPEKNYLEASNHSGTRLVLAGSKKIRIPPIFCLENQGIPVILPRQVASRGHTSLVVELCKIEVAHGNPPQFINVAGLCSPTSTLARMHELGKTIPPTISGSFIAIKFSLHHPTQALKALLKSGLDLIEQTQAWKRPSNSPGEYSRGPQLLVGTQGPLEVIAFFPADCRRNVIESGFNTLIRPERIEKLIPKIRKEWIEWDSAERAKYAPCSSPDILRKQSSDVWEKETKIGRLAHQSTTHPIEPQRDMDNLACADCKPFYQRQRSQLPSALPKRLGDDLDLNKRIATGLRLVSSQDKTFLSLLHSTAISPT